MKKLICVISAIAAMVVSMNVSAQTKDKEGHVLTGRWAEYEKAVSKDRPQDAAAVLQSIKKEAADRSLPWDWYDASVKLIDVKSSRDWKLRSGLMAELDAEVEKKDASVVYYYHFRGRRSNSDMAAWAEKNRQTLKGSCNRQFHTMNGGSKFSGILPGLLGNDYEFVIWDLRLTGDASAVAAFKDCFSGKYPHAELAEYYDVVRGAKAGDLSSLNAFARKYDGKAVALLAREDVIRGEFYKLKLTDSEQKFKDIYDRCKAFEADRARLKGTEKTLGSCCEDVKNLISTMESKSSDVYFLDDVAYLLMRNTKNVDLSLSKDGKTVFMKSVHNDRSSFYVYDTVRVQLPDLNDGEYVVKCGKEESWMRYEKYTLSIARRCDSKGQAIFVADYITGEPLKDCTVLLYTKGDESVSAKADLVLNEGFTYLPASLSSKLNLKYWNNSVQARYVDAAGRVRLSKKLLLEPSSRATAVSQKDEDINSAVLYLDRKAFNPEESVNFKAVVYKGFTDRTVCPGVKVVAELYDAESNLLESKTLKTNEFGSVYDSFMLKRARKGGLYEIRILSGGRILTSSSVRVDDFVLPSFSLSWDNDEQTYLPGDEIVVSGKIQAFSGHALSSARVTYTVRGVNDSAEKELTTASDGSFKLRFKAAEDYGSYDVTVKVLDGTGETREFSTYRHSSPYISVGVNAQSASGKICFKNKLPSDQKYTPWGIGRVQYSDDTIFSTDEAVFSLSLPKHPDFRLSYALSSGDKTLKSGPVEQSDSFRLDISDLPVGEYRLTFKGVAKGGDGKEYTDERVKRFFKLSDSETVLNTDIVSLFKELDVEDGIGVRIGSTLGDSWAAVELFGAGNQLLESRTVCFTGAVGKEGSVVDVVYRRKADYPENLTLKVIMFKDKEQFEYGVSKFVPKVRYELPLSFSRFVDRTVPGATCTIGVVTAADAECAASVFDLSTETMSPCRWSRTEAFRTSDPVVRYGLSRGVNGAGNILYNTFGDEVAVIGYGGPAIKKNAVKIRGAVASKAMVLTADVADDAMSSVVQEEAVAEAPVPEDIAIRENFAKTLAWEPALRPDSDGNVEFSFTAADKLSKYVVQLVAHDRKMNNSVLRGELVVTLPVKLEIAQPQFLHEGDTYKARVTLTNGADADVAGKLVVRLYDGKDYRNAKLLSSRSYKVNVMLGEAAVVDCPIDVPAGLEEIGILATFTANDKKNGSDAVLVSVPVLEGMQHLTESHSAILLASADRKALIDSLRKRFVNVKGSAATVREISIRQMLAEAVPTLIRPTSDNVIALSDALLADMMASSLGSDCMTAEERAEISGKILSCAHTDGGFSWFDGMTASPSITAAVLIRNSRMGGRMIPENTAQAAVKYLDENQFTKSIRPFWCGGLSMDQYAYVRSLYTDVPFAPKNADAATLKEFKKAVKEYLVPSKDRGLNGMIYAKTRRLATLRNLVSSQAGEELADKWGISSSRKLAASVRDDIESLLQYAVRHDCGGYFYPNLVMPLRGLLESEASAHAMLCDLFDDIARGGDMRPRQIADGIRFWLMIQKETQHWTSDPGYLEALVAVFHGSEEMLATKVVALEAGYVKPFEQIKAAGNGFSIQRKWFVGDKEVKEGDVLHVGDIVRAEYRISNAENRSFVRVTAPRPAALRPVNQLSGRYGWWLTPLRVPGWYSFSPQGYRSVLASKTEYWFDSYPEAGTTITEEFYVSQEGSFRSPVVEIESLYAPHYRANDGGASAIKTLYLLK